MSRLRNGRLWLRAVKEITVWRRAALLGLSVGVLQAVVNQGDYWIHHTVTGLILLKTLLSPLITFSVAWASAAATWVDKHKSETSASDPTVSLK